MKRIAIIITSILPIFIFLRLSSIYENSVMKWKIICIEYICILVICYIRVILILKKNKKILTLYNKKKYKVITEKALINDKFHSNINDLINLIIALSYRNLNEDDVFLSIMNQIINKKVLHLKYFYLCIYYMEKNANKEFMYYYEILKKIKTNNIYIELINFIHEEKTIPINLIEKSIILKNDIRTYNFIVRLNNTYLNKLNHHDNA